MATLPRDTSYFNEAMTFTQDWISNKDIVPHWVTHLSTFKGKKVQMLEIGCFEGRSTLWFLENILTNPLSRIVVVDNFKGDGQQLDMGVTLPDLRKRFEENVQKYKSKIYICEGDSKEVVRHLRTLYDVIYIDGAHHQVDTLLDMVLSFDLLRSSGVMIVDDYAMQYQDQNNVNYEPKIAIDAFVRVFDGRIQELHKGWQYIFKKL